MLSDDELWANAVAGARWARTRDLPDPVGWDDITFDPAVTVGVIRGRLADGTAPAAVHCMPLPKPGGDGLRQLTVCDPFDDVVFRSLVGRVAADIDLALSDGVLSYRLVDFGPGWQTRNHRYGDENRRAEVAEHLSVADFGGLGMLDVRQYYPSITLDPLASVLSAIGCADADIGGVVSYLRYWQEVWGVQGVPIGPEASGLLGNAFLIPADARLHDLGIPFSRYTDDFRLWLPGATWWPVARDAMLEALASLGLAANPAKTRHYETAHGVRLQLVNNDLDTLRLVLKADAALGLRITRDLFDQECAKGKRDRRRLAFLLGVLRNRVDPYGLPAAMNDPRLLQVDPRSWGRYFVRMHGHGHLDVEWALDIALSGLSAQTAAVSYRVLDAVRRRRVSRDLGRQLRDFARESGQYVPVRSMAAEAWANSDDWKPGAAAEAALAASDAQHRRALVLTLRHVDAGPTRDKALRRLRVVAPEVRPAVHWIEERGDIAA